MCFTSTINSYHYFNNYNIMIVFKNISQLQGLDLDERTI